MSVPPHTSLRHRAEQRLRSMPPADEQESVKDLQAIVEELHVYEAELQIQNEELIGSRAQIEESKKKYFRHFDLAPVGLIRMNHQGLILESNILGARMLGVDRTLLHSSTRPFLAHVALESLGAFQQHLESARASGTTEMCEIVLRNSGGIETFIRMQSVVSRGGQETMDFYTTLTDLTERRDIEQKLERLKVLADAAITSKELFFAMLSHELRTPLTPLLALVYDLAAEPGRSAEDLAAFAIMRRNLDLEIHLIDDLLDLTRVTGGKLELKFKTIDLHHCLSNAVEICRGDINAKGLDIESNLVAGSQFIRADAGRLQQVFWNLIKNAVKFTGAPGKIIIESRSHSDTHVTVEFRDTGVGIEPGPLSHIFDPFFQVNPALKQSIGGLGLGLAICKSITEAHGGSLTATSAGLGHGTTFRLVLPMVAAPDAIPTTAPEQPAPELRRQGLRLLLIEDHEDTRLVLTRLLRRRGYTVEAAQNSAEARALCLEGKFDLVITDIGLQGETGYDVLKELHATHGLSGIAMSGFDSEIDLAQGRQAGFLEYLVKPVDAETLDKVIQRVTAGR